MFFFDRLVDGRKYRVAADSVWDPRTKQPVSRQVLLGPADPAPVADLARTRTIGTRRVGDVGGLGWVAEQLNVVRHLNEAFAAGAVRSGPSAGELILAVAVQRACAPGSKRALATFLAESVPRVSCLPAERFSGQAFYRVAAGLTAAQLEQAQIAIAREAVARFALSTDVLAFDSTNFDTHIATTTPGELARRVHAKSKRRDLRVVGLGHLHDALDRGEGRPGQRTVVRDGGFWSEQLELDLDIAGYHSLISLPLSHSAAERALAYAAGRGRMKPLRGRLKDVRAARLEGPVGKLDRTLVVIESQELLRGQKRGIAVALSHAQVELRTLRRRAEAQRITRDIVATRVQKILAREHLAEFVVVTIGGRPKKPNLRWRVDAARRRTLERTRLGRRVLCTDHKFWSTERIVTAFRGQWNVEELFRRAKKGGLVPWGPSYQWADPSLRLHTFATVLGLMLIALAKLALGTRQSARAMMKELADIKATLARTRTGHRGRRPTIMIPPELSPAQRKAVKTFELARWMPTLSSTM